MGEKIKVLLCIKNQSSAEKILQLRLYRLLNLYGGYEAYAFASGSPTASVCSVTVASVWFEQQPTEAAVTVGSLSRNGPLLVLPNFERIKIIIACA